jgi:hypothetical protein
MSLGCIVLRTQRILIGALACGTLFVYSATSVRAGIVNGDFEAGNTGFSSDYSYAAVSDIPDHYTVAANPDLFNTNLESFGDHTTGAGLMMLADGSSPSSDVWSETVSMAPNTNYTFSAWVRDTDGANLPQIQLHAASLGDSAVLTPTDGQWEKLTLNFNSGAATAVLLSITDENPSPLVTGDDFALDDITGSGTSVSSVPLPSAAWSFLSLVGGLGLMHLVRRRVRSQA